VRPVEGLLPAADVDLLVDAAMRAGGAITSRTLPDGGTAVYELNSTWYALMAAGVPEEAALRRHLAAHAIMLALRGIPATYVHSVVASGNDREGYARSGEARALHRARFDDVAAFRRAVADPTTRPGAAWLGLRRMLEARASTAAFHPDSGQTVLDAPPHVFAVERCAESGERARVYVNVSRAPATVDLGSATWTPLAGQACVTRDGRVELAPWSSAWLRS
jgi:hypothetical protein